MLAEARFARSNALLDHVDGSMNFAGSDARPTKSPGESNAVNSHPRMNIGAIYDKELPSHVPDMAQAIIDAKVDICCFSEAMSVGDQPDDNQIVHLASLRRAIAVGTPIAERPPAQIPACAIHALGSHLGCLTENRWSGHG